MPFGGWHLQHNDIMQPTVRMHTVLMHGHGLAVSSNKKKMTEISNALLLWSYAFQRKTGNQGGGDIYRDQGRNVDWSFRRERRPYSRIINILWCRLTITTTLRGFERNWKKIIKSWFEPLEWILWLRCQRVLGSNPMVGSLTCGHLQVRCSYTFCLMTHIWTKGQTQGLANETNAELP